MRSVHSKPLDSVREGDFSLIHSYTDVYSHGQHPLALRIDAYKRSRDRRMFLPMTLLPSARDPELPMTGRLNEAVSKWKMEGMDCSDIRRAAA